MFDKVLAYLNEERIGYTTNNEEGVIVFLAKMQFASFHCIFQISEKTNFLIFYTVISAIVPEEKRQKMAELLTRINNDVAIGNFEMDFQDGEIRFRSSMDYEGSELSSKTIDNLVIVNLSISDDYFYSIIRCIDSDLTPEELLKSGSTDNSDSVKES